MSRVVDEALLRVAKVTGIVFFGRVVGMVLGLVGTIIIVRYLTTTEYGVLALATTLVGVVSGLAMLGLWEGISRYVAYFIGKDDHVGVLSVVRSGFKIVVVSSILFSSFLFLFSGVFSSFLGDQQLSSIIRVLVFTIPFSALSGVIVSVFRGFGVADVQVYFNNLLANVLRIMFFGVVVLLGLSLMGVVYAQLCVSIFTCTALAFYTVRKAPIPFRGVKVGKPMGKELLSFSLPIFGLSITGIIVTSTDRLMLGYFKTAESVGLYSVAATLANLIPILLASMGYIYTPVVSQLYAKKLLGEMRRAYAVLTKWVFSATLPVFLVMFLFPSSVLNILFGAKYLGATLALQLLALGFFVHTFLGPNGLTLIVMGKTRVLFVFAAFQAATNVLLNFLLIPRMGVVGAATASAISLVVTNVLVSTKLYSLTRVHPFTKNYLKPVVISVFTIFVVSTIVKNVFTDLNIMILVLVFILFLVVYGLAVLLTRSFDHEDITILLTIERRTGVNTTPIKKVLKKFV